MDGTMAESTDIKPRSLKYARFADQLRQQIVTGELKPGDQLPSFAHMMANFNVGQSTIERMYALLEQEGMVVRAPNQGIFVAIPKKRGATGSIGLITSPRTIPHPYHVRLLTAVQAAAHAVNMEISLLYETSRIGFDRIDGLLLCQGHADRILQRLAPDLPAVSLIHLAKTAPSVVADETEGMRAAIRYLLERGHERIAMLSCGVQSWMNIASKQRLITYQDTLKAAGIKPLNRWSRPVFEPFDGDFDFRDNGYRKTRQWIEENWRQLGCTALLAHNDDVAIGAIDAFREVGIRVPEDVSVVGFDGTEISEVYRPRLTTVEMPLAEIGARGVGLLMQQIAAREGAAPGPERPIGDPVIFPTQLRIRESTAEAHI